MVMEYIILFQSIYLATVNPCAPEGFYEKCLVEYVLHHYLPIGKMRSTGIHHHMHRVPHVSKHIYPAKPLHYTRNRVLLLIRINDHSPCSILFFLSRLLHTLRVLPTRDDPPHEFDKEKSTDADTSVVHIRSCDCINAGPQYQGTGEKERAEYLLPASQTETRRTQLQRPATQL